jgi:hypothetical protein
MAKNGDHRFAPAGWLSGNGFPVNQGAGKLLKSLSGILIIFVFTCCHYQVARHNSPQNTSGAKESAKSRKTIVSQKESPDSEKKVVNTPNELPSEKRMAFVYEPETRIGESKESRTDKFFTSSFLTTPKKDELMTISKKPEEPKLGQPKILALNRTPSIEMQELEPIEILTTDEKEGKKDIQPVFMYVEEKATFQGGDLQKFQRYILENFKISESVQSYGVSGKVIAQFVVGTQGKVENIKIIKGLNFGADNEMVRVLQNSPPWKPAKQGGKAVKQRFILPLSIDLKPEP